MDLEHLERVILSIRKNVLTKMFLNSGISLRVIASHFLYSVDKRLLVTEYITGLFLNGLHAL